MITQWDDLVGHKVTGRYFAYCGTILLLDENEFAVLVGVPGDYEDEAFVNLADANNEDALDAAVLAGAPGAHKLRARVVAQRLQQVRETELQRLEYLRRKYPEGGESNESNS